MPRSLSGESLVIASQILLKQDTNVSGGIQSSLVDVMELFLLATEVEKVLFDTNSDSPASQKVVDAYLASQLAQYRRLDTLVPFSEVDGLQLFLNNYRLLGNLSFEQVLYKDSPGVFLDLKTKIDALQPRKQATQLIQQDHTHLYQPKQTRVRRVSNTQLFQDTYQTYSPSITRQYLSTNTQLFSDTYHWYNVSRTAPDPVYSLGNPDSAGNKGRIALYKNGSLVPGSEFQFLPTPVAHAHNLLSVTPGPAPNEFYFLNNPSGHSFAHPAGSGSGSADGVISSLSLDTQTTSPNFGMLTAIRSDGVAVSSTQKTTDIHPTLADFTSLQSTITLQNAINSGLFTLHASQIGALQSDLAALTARVAQLEADAVTFKFNGGTAVPLKQLQLRSGDFPGTAYYNTSGILMASITTPPLQNPY